MPPAGRPRIAVIRQRYNPFGGAERFVERALGALRARGASVTLVARDWPQGASSDFIRVDPFHVGRVWRDRSFARAVCARLERESFDLVQSHERLCCCDVYRAGDGVHRQWLENRARVLGPLGRLGMRLNPYHCYVLDAEREMFDSPRLRAVICNSRMVRDEIRRHFGVDEAKLHVVYNGVDLDAFHPRLRAEHRTAMRAKLGIAERATVHLFVGSGFERKGVDRALDALARLPDRTARLLIVGKDKAEGAMRRRAAALGIADRVQFAGGQPDVRPWYGAADCFVLPTLYDPFPNAALEALACGLPVVVSTQCGAAELVESGRNGFVCDALDVDCLASVMTTVASRGPSGFAEAARASVAHLGLAQMAERLVALYEGLLAGRRV